MEYSENRIRDFVLEQLINKIGNDKSVQILQLSSKYVIEKKLTVITCEVEGLLKYDLPNGFTLTHKSDILFSILNKNHITQKSYISIEVKHKSAVTDQFKSRTYDMIHLKQTYGAQIFGILLYIKTNKGISGTQAAKISYSYDKFFLINFAEIDKQGLWDEFCQEVISFLFKTG